MVERAEGKAGELDEDDTKRLDGWLAERPGVAPERLRALAGDRAAAVAGVLRERHGIGADRVTTAEPAATTPDDAKPAVVITFGAVGE
jgi:hypothetical protein